jgi:flagellar hook-associated protein 2
MVSPIRFSGMASGLDTEKIIKELMKAEQAPVNRLKRNKQLEEWKRDSYREMNALLLDLQKTVDTLRFSGNFNKKIATSENDSYVSAKVTGKPSLSTYTVEVRNLAKAATPPMKEFSVDPSITNPSANIGGSDFSFTISKDLDGNGSIDPATEQKTISVTAASSSIDSIINEVNAAGMGVKASYFNNKLVFTSENSTTFTIDVTDNGSKLGMGTDTTHNSNAGTPADPATVVINGVEYKSNTNTFTFDGIEFTAKQPTAANTSIAIQVKTDEDAVFNMIKGFVDKYNEVIDKINKKISEPKYKGYEPLLDEEIEALPEKTAEKLENMAKSGILLRDPILKTGLDEMRRAIYTPLQGTGVKAAFDTLSEIGIGGPPTGKYAYMENGKLYIDETKLRSAISNNGEEVMKLFTNYSSTQKYGESGIAERLYDTLTDTINQITKQAGSSTSVFDDSSITKRIRAIDDEIDRWEDRLKAIEDRYWKQFTAMEQAMARSQSQSSWFAQMLGQQ